MYVCIHESSVILWATAANVYNDGPLGDGDSCPKEGNRTCTMHLSLLFALRMLAIRAWFNTYFAFSFLEKRYIVEEPPASFHDSSMT